MSSGNGGGSGSDSSSSSSIKDERYLTLGNVEECKVLGRYRGLNALAAASVGTWSCMKFHGVKYLNDKLLDPTASNSILLEAEEIAGLTRFTGETEDYRPALKRFIRHKFNQMRDYYVQKVKESVMALRKCLIGGD